MFVKTEFSKSKRFFFKYPKFSEKVTKTVFYCARLDVYKNVDIYRKSYFAARPHGLHVHCAGPNFNTESQLIKVFSVNQLKWDGARS